MFGWALRQIQRLTIFIASLILIWAGATRAFQPGLPPLLYSTGESTALYLAEVGCPFFTQPCAADGRRLLDGLYFLWSTAAWSPDGEYVAVHRADGWVVYPTACLLGGVNCLPTLLDVTDNRVTWGPNGEALAAVNPTGTLLNLMTRACWDDSIPDSCVRHQVELNQSGSLFAPYWSANGERIVFINTAVSSVQTFEIHCLDSACMDETTPAIQRAGVFWPVLSPNGAQVVFAADTRSGPSQAPRKQLFLSDLISGETQRLTFSPYEATMPDWSRDGRYVAFSGFPTPNSGDLALYMLDLERRLTVRFLSRPGTDLLFPGWGPGLN
jgi:hypothetical protein